MRNMLGVLVITTLFPNRVQQRHGIFVETRLLHLIESGDIQATVIAPVPWFPFKLKAFPEYSKYVDVPREETRKGVVIHHPRYLVIPRVGMLLTPFFLALSVCLKVRKLRKQGLAYDLVDAHYYYPDGVAVAIVAKFLAKPFVVTARGTDINLIPEYSIPRRMILWAEKRASASFTVSKAMKMRMVKLGVDPGRIHVMRNGVNFQFFRPLEREVCRKKYGLVRPTLVSVGNLIELKGHHIVIDALRFLPELDLVIVGDGPEEVALREQVAATNLTDRVTFLGTVSQDQLVEIYNAADILVLASSREGLANVLLESMACGTPVVATRVGGSPEVVCDHAAGILVEDRSAHGIAESIKCLQENLPSRDETRLYAQKFSWGETVESIKHVFAQLSSGRWIQAKKIGEL